jgi:serine/threonine protein kinase
MSTPLNPPQAKPRFSEKRGVDHEAEELAALVAFDERLREGIDVLTTGDGGELRLPEQALTDCLRWIEEVWPRSGNSSTRRFLPLKVGRFEIERVLGQGGFGIVYLARDPLLGRKVALKVPRLHAQASEPLRERFRREARATAALEHPNIVLIHETGEVGPLCYIAFAYCEGPSLAQWLRDSPAPLSCRVAAQIVAQLADAMHYSHSRGVLHRDLKPTNVLLFPTSPTVSGEDALPFVPRIVDFGLARLVEEELEATGSSAVIGTPLYMAPEQALCRPETVGPAADIYALGAILYELLIGHPPFTGSGPLDVLDQVRHLEPTPVRKIRPDVPIDLETICIRCLQKRPAERYSSAQSLADDLGRYLAGQSIVAKPVSVWHRVLHVCEQSQRINEAGLAVIVAHAAVILSMLMTLYMIQTNVIERPVGFSFASWSPPALGIIFTTHVPLVFVGWVLLRKRRAWAAWLSFVTGAAMVVISMLFVLGCLPKEMNYWDAIPGFRIFYPMMAVILAFQTIMSGVALLALRPLAKRNA